MSEIFGDDSFLAGPDSPGEGFEDEATHDEAPEPLFPNVFAFVVDHLAHVYEREAAKMSTFRWCARWYEHPEAVSRLEGLWKAFEALRLDPTVGASTWWRDHADPAMSALSSGNGPFRQCTPDQHAAPQILPTVGLPDGLMTSGTVPEEP